MPWFELWTWHKRSRAIPVFLKVTLSLPRLWGLLFSLSIPFFEWGPQSKEILLNLGMKCWNSTFNGQCWRVIIVVLHVGAVKIYVAASSGGAQEKWKTGWNSVYQKKTVALALRKNERQDETQFTKKNCCISEFHNKPPPSAPLSPWMLMYFFGGFFFNLTRFCTKLRVLVLCFPDFAESSIKWL